MIKLKDEYKTAVIGGFDGKHRIEMLFCDPRLYPLIAKDFPHFFYEDKVEVKEEVGVLYVKETPDMDLIKNDEVEVKEEVGVLYVKETPDMDLIKKDYEEKSLTKKK
jgi:hypothetical protein